MPMKPDWVKQADWNASQKALRAGGQEAENMKKFLASVAGNRPSEAKQAAISRRMQSNSPTSNVPSKPVSYYIDDNTNKKRTTAGRPVPGPKATPPTTGYKPKRPQMTPKRERQLRTGQ